MPFELKRLVTLGFPATVELAMVVLESSHPRIFNSTVRVGQGY
jgi:hypothetical protein